MKKIYITTLLFISSLLANASDWEMINFSRLTYCSYGYCLSVMPSPLMSSKNGDYWDGTYFPLFRFIYGVGSIKTVEFAMPCSKNFFDYAICTLTQYDTLKTTEGELKKEWKDFTKDSIMRMSVSFIDGRGDASFYYKVPIGVFLTAFEFALNDANLFSEPKYEKEIAEMRKILLEELNKYSKEFIEISCGDGVVALRDGMLSLRKKNKDGTFSVIAQTTADGTDLMAAYLKANGGQTLLEGMGKVTINKGFGNEDKGLSYLLKTRVLWNYFAKAASIQKPDDAKAVFIEIKPEDIKQEDLEIPATFPENLKTPEAAKALALAAYNKKYLALKTQDGATLTPPEKFIYKIVKLKSTVDKFATEGTALWQVDMYDAASNLICSAWINPENASEALSQINPQTIFSLEPLSALKTISVKFGAAHFKK